MTSLIAHRLSDEHLGRRLASGEAPAFDELYRRYVHRLAAYGTHLLGDGASGDDVAQVALMRAYQALRAGRVPDRLRPWLYRIAHNAAIDAVRNRQELPTGDLPERPGEVRDGTAGALVEAVAALPDRQRRVYVLRELHGLRIGETAAELGLTTQQVEQSLFAARNRLAELLVFGERLGCATVRRLAEGPLDLRERRALKTHVRSCPACRRELGVRGVALSVLPLPSFGWLRGALAGGAPATVKVAAVVAAATVAVGVPIAATTHKPHARLPRPLTGAPGPDVPLALAATRQGPAAHTRVRRAAAPKVTVQRISAPTQTAPVFAVPVTPVAAATTQPVGAGSTTPAQPQPAPTAAAQPSSSFSPSSPPPAAAPGDAGGGTTTTSTTEDPPPTTTTTTATDGGGTSSGSGDVSSTDGTSGDAVATPTSDTSTGDPVTDGSGGSDGGGMDSTSG